MWTKVNYGRTIVSGQRRRTGAKPEYAQLIGVHARTRMGRMPPSVCSIANVDALSRVGEGRGEGPNALGKVCPVNRYSLMTSIVTTGMATMSG
jgi:hypothetical protein